MKTVRQVVEGDFAVVRSRLLSVPSKVAGVCEGRTREEIEEIIRAECSEALEELHRS